MKFDLTDPPIIDVANPPEIIEFNGVIYRRMGGARRYYLSQSTTNVGRKGAKGLHVAIWEASRGRPVPPGHEVNHRDHNTFNFDPDNLECLPKGAHRALPKQYGPEQSEHLARIRPLASAWHRSPEGRAWHRENVRKHPPGSRAAAIQAP